MKKTLLITGSTDGIGRLVAEQFAQEGHTVLMHGRNAKKLSDAVNHIKAQTGNDNVKGFVADFSDLDQVQSMADQLSKEVDRLDVLINNAGVYNSPIAKNNNGLDVRLVVNYYAPYILTNALMSLLEKDNSRIVNLGSAAQAPVAKGVLLGKTNATEGEAYAQSKLAITMWSFYLTQKHPSISTVVVNPGSLLNTKMANTAFGTHWSPASKGADILFDLALTYKAEQINGKYYDNDKEGFGKAHPDAYSQIKIEELIAITKDVVAG